MTETRIECDALTRHIAENIDRLINLDVSGYGVIGRLYEAARAHHREPLTLLAAARLRERVKPQGHVFVTSGWIMPGVFPYGETDGPIGAAIIGRALALGLGARMVVLTEDRMVAATTAACRAAGLNVLSEDDIARAPRAALAKNLYCVIVPFPYGDAEALRASGELFDRYAPAAMIAIEKNGPNDRGEYCMVDGEDNSDCVIRAGRLFEEAARRGVLTIGIGDRGNEIGFGTIKQVPQTLLPKGARATCTLSVDVLVTAAVSNWGAAGIAATLAALLDRPEVLHDAATEARMLEKSLDAGAIDGFAYRPVPMTDGMLAGVHVAITTILNELVRAPAATGPLVASTPLFRREKRR
jgi:hypothetical protein